MKLDHCYNAHIAQSDNIQCSAQELSGDISFPVVDVVTECSVDYLTAGILSLVQVYILLNCPEFNSALLCMLPLDKHLVLVSNLKWHM